jgi:DNA primase
VTRYTADSRDRVRDAVDMLTLVSPSGDLRRMGANRYVGLCPFHDERTPSFQVVPDEKRYYCFGCQASGDAFTFVMETEGVDFVGALETLADRFGVALETEDEDPGAAARRKRRERLYELLGRATTYYARYLWESGEAAGARSYLLGRGLTEATLREFRVGYAPSAWDRILLASRHAGFTDEELLAVGLAQRSQSRPGSIFDRFRERIIFPLADARGRVLGFGARAMRDNQRPKYLNTSENELYHKGNQLFGIDLARGPAARAGRALLVEGYTDVLALHQAGLPNAVGIMGTALTEEQLRALESIARVLELCLDADAAGQEAMLRAAKLASGRNLELRVVALPEGNDPADLVLNEGVDAVRERAQHSVPFVVFQVQRILDGADTSSGEGRDRAFTELRPVLAEVPPSSLRDELVRRVAGRLELPERRLESLLGGGPARPAGAETGNANARAPSPLDQGARAERTFLVLCLSVPDAGRVALAAIDPDDYLTNGPLRRAARHLVEHLDSPLADIAEDEELTRVILELLDRKKRFPNPTPDRLEDRLEHARLVLELARLDRAIRRARGESGADTSALAREREEVLRAVRSVVSRLEDAA